MEHSHSFSGVSTLSKGHVHHYGEVTNEAPSTTGHTHSMKGSTTFNLEHSHRYSTRTGPAIKLPNGLHYHRFETKVEITKDHFHYISGNTSAD